MKPIGSRWRELRVEADLDFDLVAGALNISVGHLKNIESEQPKATVSDRLARRASRFFKVPISDLCAEKERVPDEPPSREQDPETNTGPGRDSKGGTGPGTGGKSGPKRVKDAASRAVA